MKNSQHSQPTVEAIETFLTLWATKAEATCIKLVADGYALNDKRRARSVELNTSSYVELKADAEYTRRALEATKYWETLPKYLSQFSSTSMKIAEPQIKKLIAKDVENKRIKLYQDVTSKIGAIVDGRGLSVGEDGSINGIVVGETGSVKISTIMAGGYNIQCLHYRVLIKVLGK